MICEALLLSDKLTWKSSDLWCQTFALIRRIIGGVDYKVRDVLSVDRSAQQKSVGQWTTFISSPLLQGCRDLLRQMLEKTQSVPVSENVSTLACVSAVEGASVKLLIVTNPVPHRVLCNSSNLKLYFSTWQVVSYILDRNACLLPSYFAVNEITKLYSEEKPWPHWVRFVASLSTETKQRQKTPRW